MKKTKSRFKNPPTALCQNPIKLRFAVSQGNNSSGWKSRTSLRYGLWALTVTELPAYCGEKGNRTSVHRESPLPTDHCCILAIKNNIRCRHTLFLMLSRTRIQTLRTSNIILQRYEIIFKITNKFNKNLLLKVKQFNITIIPN